MATESAFAPPGDRGPAVHILLSELGHLMPPGEEWRVVEYARIIEREGAAGCSMGGHVVLGPASFAKGPLKSPHAPLVPGHIPPDTPQLEPLVTLAAIAGATSTLRLSTCILIAALYPPALLAKTVASLDAMSGGRLELGLGTSWHEQEFNALGVPFADRGAITDDTLAALRALWSGEPVSGKFAGAHFDDIRCEPRPHQVGGVPIAFGGRLTAPVLRRIVEYGSAWLAQPTLPDLGPHLTTLRNALEAAGRDPDSVELRTLLLPELDSSVEFADLDVALRPAASRVELGCTAFFIGPAPFCATPEDVGPFVREVVSRVRALA